MQQKFAQQFSINLLRQAGAVAMKRGGICKPIGKQTKLSTTGQPALY